MEAVVDCLRTIAAIKAMTDAAKSGKRDFFISFAGADRPWAIWIAWTLEEAGYSVVFQDWDFKGNFVVAMDRAVKETRHTIAVLSPDYLTSGFATTEWAAAFARDATSEHDRLIPIRVRLCEPDGLLAQIVYEDLIGRQEPEAKQQLLQRVSELRRKPAEQPLFPGPPQREILREKPSFPIPDHNLPLPTRSFVGRGEELEELHRALVGTGRSAITQPRAITGLGGVGKTQLALHYAYAHLTDYDLIRWLRAEEPATLAADYAGMAPALGLDPETRTRWP